MLRRFLMQFELHFAFVNVHTVFKNTRQFHQRYAIYIHFFQITTVLIEYRLVNTYPSYAVIKCMILNIWHWTIFHV